MTDTKLILTNSCKKNGFTLSFFMEDYGSISIRHGVRQVAFYIDEKNSLHLTCDLYDETYQLCDLKYPYDVDLACTLYDMMNNEGW